MNKNARLLYAIIFSLALITGTAKSAPPSWWTDPAAPVVEEGETAEENYAPANLGQLKNIAKKAAEHLDDELYGGAGEPIWNDYIKKFEPRALQGYTQQQIDAFIAENYAPINLGQLKAIAKPFYDRLHAAGFDTKASLIGRGFTNVWVSPHNWSGYYPWNPSTPLAENYAPANIGQLKMVFSFDLMGFDIDKNGLPDSWESLHFGYIGNDPEGDFDQDGLTNEQELAAGSDPKDFYSQGSTPITPFLTIAGGNGQLGASGEYLHEPLQVEVRNGSSTGALLENAPVSFEVTTGAGGLSVDTAGIAADATLVIRTGNDGMASVNYREGTAGLTNIIDAHAGATTVSFESLALGKNWLVAHWAFEDGSGTTASDSGPFAMNGTIFGTTEWSTRYVGEGSFAFDGTSTSVAMGSPSNEMLDFEDASFSVVAWVKMDTPLQAGHILGKGQTGWTAGYEISMTASGRIRASLGTTQTGVASEGILIDTTSSFANSQWHQVVAVFDRAASQARIYVDGVAQPLTLGAGTGGAISSTDAALLEYAPLLNLSGANSTASFTVGASETPSDFFKGAIDDIRVYRKALGAAEILDLRTKVGTLTALAQNAIIDEDTLGAFTLQSLGGSETTATYEIVTAPANGTAELNGDIISYYPNGHFNGTDLIRFRVTKGGRASEANINITVRPQNDPPLVSVGGAQSVTIPSPLAISAIVTDIDTAPANIKLSWSKVEGPGEVTFSASSSSMTTITFSVQGQYMLRLFANDGKSIRSDSVIVTVNPAGTSEVPTVDLSAPIDNAMLGYSQPFIVQASASAPTGQTVNKVEFYEGSRKIGEALSPNPSSSFYQMSWTPQRIGAYALSATVTSSAGLKGTSNVRQILVADGGWFSGSGIQFGNEGYAGSGGVGGLSFGAATGTGSGFDSSTGGNGGGSSSNGGGNGFGGDKYDESIDSDFDGLSDSEELKRGSNPALEDSDGDGLNDALDAVPNIKIMRVPAATEMRYAIVDLGEYYPQGLNDDGVLRLYKMNRTYRWENGEITDLGSFEFILGPLQDGSMLVRGGQQLAGDRPSGNYRYIYQFNDGKTAWAEVHAGGSGASPTRTFSLYNVDQVAVSAMNAALSLAHSFFPAHAAMTNYPDDFEPAEGWEGLGIEYVNAVNDAGGLMYSASSSTEVFYNGGYALAEIYGWKSSTGSQAVSSKYFSMGPGWYWFFLPIEQYWITLQPSDRGGYDSFRVMVNADDVSVGVLKSIDSGIRQVGFFNGVNSVTVIPNCVNVGDLNRAVTSEGPYVSGVDYQGKARIWCKGDLEESVEIGEGYNSEDQVFGGVVGRSISDDLVVPQGRFIWRNGRSVEVSNLVGEGFVNLSVRSISPKKNLLIGEGWKDGVRHGLLLLPVELVSKDRLLQGSVEIPEGRTGFSLSFKNKTTGEDLGTYENLEPGGQTDVKIYDDSEDFFNDEEMADALGGSLPEDIRNQKVVFARDPENERRLRFCAVFDGLGDVEVKLKFGVNQVEGVAGIKLTRDEPMAEFIGAINSRVQSIEVPGSEEVPIDADGDGLPEAGGSSGAGDILQAYNAGTMAVPGAPVWEGHENNPDNLVLAINDDKDDGDGSAVDNADTIISSGDNDIVTLLLKVPANVPADSGVMSLSVSGAGVRVFRPDGAAVLNNYSVNLAVPSGDLAALAAERRVKIFIEGLSASSNVTFTLKYTNSVGQILYSDSVSMKVVARDQLSWLYSEGAIKFAYGDSERGTIRSYADNGMPIYESISLALIGEVPTIRNRGMLAKIFFDLPLNAGKTYIAWPKGFVDGFFVAAKGEIDGAVDVWVFLSDDPYGRSAVAWASVKEALAILKEIPPEELEQVLRDLPANLYHELYTASERNLPWVPIRDDLSPDVLKYMDGFGSGMIVESIAVSATGAGLAAKVGTVVKGVLSAAKSSQYSLSALSALRKATVKASHILLRLARTREDAAAMGAIGKYLEGVGFPSGKKGSERFVEAFHDSPELTNRFLKKYDEFWGALPEERRVLRYKLAALRVAHLKEALGDRLSEDALEGFGRLQKRLFVDDVDHSDRYSDLLGMWDGLNSNEAKQSMADSLVSYKLATDEDVAAAFVVKGIEDVYSHMYHYMPAADFRFIRASGSGGFFKDPYDVGTYVSPDIFNDPLVATSKLQLPDRVGFAGEERARYRLKFTTSAWVGDEVEIPNGYNHLNGEALEWLEPVTRDNSFKGVGGARQGVSKRALHVAEVFDAVQGRALTELEVFQLMQLYN